MKALLTTQGVARAAASNFLERLAAARLWDGSAVPDGVRERVRRVWEQLLFLTGQLAEVDAERAALTPAAAGDAGRWAIRLATVQGVGSIGAWCLSTEIFSWRQIRNRRELAALVGIVQAPYHSGDTTHDQGITRAGNRHVRRMIVQLAWSWLRYQPTSALSRWYRERFTGSRRSRRIGIVALARKLLIALRRLGPTGQRPEGAQLKPVVG